jgi:two-component system alkaline phosphatase synthesis response regulator PhoP
MGKKILVVDDEQDIVGMLQYNLQKAGFEVITAFHGAEALAKAELLPDLIILDVMMPEMDGWEVCRELKRRARTSLIPIIFLTARGDEIDEVVGLELGADDYIAKPISIAKLMARIRSVFRKKEEQADTQRASEVLTIQDLKIDPGNYQVHIGDRKPHLTKKEFETLLYLATHPDKVVTRETLLREVWGENVHVTERTVDVHIRKIREKLGPQAVFIETVKGVGYRFRTAAA